MQVVNFKGVTFMAVNAKPRPAVRQRVIERAKAGVCLHCESPATRVGLCDHHYHDYRMELIAKSETEREVWIGEQIREGNVLKAGEIRRIKKASPFREGE
jgi:hypothetical protein